jgi:hypothetical protein
MVKSNIEKQLKKWTVTIQCIGALVVIGVGASLYLENYFTLNPTVEDLYYGTNKRVDTLWAIAFAVLGILLGYCLVGLFRIRSLRKQLPNQNPIKTVAIEVQRPSSSKADELTKLSRLKTEGLISESEFESLKKEIIG